MYLESSGMKQYKKWLLSISLALTMLLFVQSLSIAQSQTPELTPVNTRQVEGTLNRIEGSTLFIQSDDNVQQVNVPSGITITRNGSTVGLNELAVNDRVVVTTADNSVIRVEATSEALIEGASTALMVSLGLIALSIIGFMLWRKSTQSHIKSA